MTDDQAPLSPTATNVLSFEMAPFDIYNPVPLTTIFTPDTQCSTRWLMPQENSLYSGQFILYKAPHTKPSALMKDIIWDAIHTRSSMPLSMLNTALEYAQVEDLSSFRLHGLLMLGEVTVVPGKRVIYKPMDGQY